MRMLGLAARSAAIAAVIGAVGTGMVVSSAVRPAAPGRPAAAGSAARRAAKPGAALAAGDIRVRTGICSAPSADRTLAAKLSADIQGALRDRTGHHAVTVYDAVTGVYCAADDARHFDSASIVKVIILAALLRWHQEDGTRLSSWEQEQATLMITQSDNDAATDLWDEVGLSRLQQFLDLAKMNETELGLGGYWGLTQVTAHDEMLLLELLTEANPVLSASSRSYELALMAQVIPSQRWGTPAGAPGDVTVQVKNGWLPDATGWHINSIGAFTGKKTNYMIAVLTDDNPSEQYGIGTVQGVARPVHRDLERAAAAQLAATPLAPPSSWAVVPALPTPPAPPPPPG